MEFASVLQVETKFKQIIIYRFFDNIWDDTCLNRTSFVPAYVFRIDRCSIYTG